MALETANTINQLVESNPLGTDTKSQGDDHIRLIKKTLRNTFPNLTGPITVSEAAINGLGSGKNLTFPGMIVMWSGATAPSGWLLCNGVGTLSNGQAVPDLRGKFIVGAGGGTSIGDTGGALVHNHPVAISGTSLSVDQVPEHSHQVSYNRVTPDGSDMYVGESYEPLGPVNFGSASAFHNRTSSTIGKGDPHTHTAVATEASSLPPYYSLAFIIKE